MYCKVLKQDQSEYCGRNLSVLIDGIYMYHDVYKNN